MLVYRNEMKFYDILSQSDVLYCYRLDELTVTFRFLSRFNLNYSKTSLSKLLLGKLKSIAYSYSLRCAVNEVNLLDNTKFYHH